jgi:RNA-directed DNA polymerase
MKQFSWEKVNWSRVESRVKRLQNRIYKSSTQNSLGKVLFLQGILIRSLDAKLLAVRRVTTDNRGKSTPGLDQKIYLSPSSKIGLVRRLKVDGRAAPIRRVMVPKPGRSEKRPLGIPIIRDRAKQMLVLLALEPQWEARFEPNSYGFRPGRSPLDAMEAVFSSIRVIDHKSHEKFIVDADLRKCFDNIDHSFLVSRLDTLSVIRSQVLSWLEAGSFLGASLAPEDYDDIPKNLIGTPQGGVISPFLCNVALHGMEFHLKKWIVSQSWPVSKRHQKETKNKQNSISLIRFADDFLITHSNKDVAFEAKEEVARWLSATSKLSFNEEKTVVRSSKEGFHFLGFTFIHIKSSGSYTTKIYPSKKNRKRLVYRVGGLCRKLRSASTYDLIKSLRPVVLGWARYYRTCECKRAFSRMDFAIYHILRSWVFRRDRRHGRMRVKEKYFPSGESFVYEGRSYKNNWVLVGKKVLKHSRTDVIFLPKLSWVSSVKHVKVRGLSSIYDGDHIYWSLRLSRYSYFDTRTRNLLKMQSGRCNFCGQLFDPLSVMEVDHIIPLFKGGKDVYSNLQLLHRHCHVSKTRLDLN